MKGYFQEFLESLSKRAFYRAYIESIDQKFVDMIKVVISV